MSPSVACLGLFLCQRTAWRIQNRSAGQEVPRCIVPSTVHLAPAQMGCCRWVTLLLVGSTGSGLCFSVEGWKGLEDPQRLWRTHREGWDFDKQPGPGGTLEARGQVSAAKVLDSCGF